MSLRLVTPQLKNRKLLDPGLNLTPNPDPRTEEIQRSTWRGQAHWAVGPSTCQVCGFWDDLNRNHKNSSVVRACSKFSELMNGQIGPRVPGRAASCKYFEPSAGAQVRRELAAALCSSKSRQGELQ
jgi:hypothetical protein